MPGLTDTIIAAENIKQGRERNRLQELSIGQRQQNADRNFDLSERQLQFNQQQFLENLKSKRAATEEERDKQSAATLIEGIAKSDNAAVFEETMRIAHEAGVLDDKDFAASQNPNVRNIIGVREEQAQLATRLKAEENKLRKEKLAADTQASQQKAAESARKAAEAEKTAEDVRLKALSLLGPDFKIRPDVARAFGAFQGALPTVRGSTIDVEADVEQLVSLLTLENTDKMAGVLSETDIKILRDAGTILGNRRISDERAEEELQKIAQVFEKLQPQQIGRFTVTVKGQE